jgi:hypothetical protein
MRKLAKVIVRDTTTSLVYIGLMNVVEHPDDLFFRKKYKKYMHINIV